MRGELFLEDDLREVMIEALDDAQVAFGAINSNKLKEISDYTLHYAGIFQDSYSVSIAVIMYSLAKIVEKRKFRAKKEWERFNAGILYSLSRARGMLQKNNLKQYLAELKKILAAIGRVDEKFGDYVTEVIQKAKIKKGSLVYEHGLSVGRAAELMGVSPWELMDYLGKTKILDESPIMSKPVSERLDTARRIFNIK
ncbi:MAG TPA: hypothetical protein HA362_05730 [Nanoarchaeota archaeon]|nr:hypothetical protein [Nanoarchaeota archaeon]